MTPSLAPLARNATGLAVAAGAFALAVGLPAGDPDMWWHLATGKWMVEHGEGLRVDVFSSTATGEPYALGEWLGDVVLYGAYALAGWSGVAFVRAALVSVAAFVVTRLALRTAPARSAVPIAVVALLLSTPLWTDRPQLVTLALFPLVLELCLAARAGSRTALVATALVIALWAHAHSGYALGVATVWLFSLEALIERRPIAGWLAIAVGTTALVSLMPGALALLRAFGHVAGSTIRVAEESPIDPLTPTGMLFAVFLGATLLALMRRGGSLLGAMAMIPMLALALVAQKHVALFAFTAVPFVSGPLSAIADEVGTTLRRVRADGGLLSGGQSPLGAYTPPSAQLRIASDDPRASRSRSKSSPLVLAAAMWLAALASIAVADPRPDLARYPTTAIAALESSSGVLLNEYDWGGYLIWSVPSRPVFVDSRLYPFAGNGVVRSYQEAIHVLPSWRAVIERWNVSQALLRPDRPLVQALRDEGWTVRAQDARSVLLERPR